MSQGPEPDDPWGARKAAHAPEPAPAAPQAPDATPAALAVATPVAFTGTRGEWLRILARGLALYIPTFGFYRFWLKTDQRRFIWRSIAVNGQVLEYHGTARELLVGFLFAIAIYLPLTVAYTLLGIYAETLQAFASIPFALFTVVFGYYAVFRARRYRLTRTVFRGVRFWMDGSAWRFAFTALGWMVLAGVTLGLAWPWAAARLEQIKWRHSHYGDLAGDFDGTGWDLAKALFLPAVGLVVVAVIPFANLIGVPAMLAVLLTLYARWLVNGVSFGPVRLRTSIESSALIGPALVTMAAVSLFVTLWLAVGYVAFWSYLLKLAAFEAPDGSDAAVLSALLGQAPWLALGFGWGLVGLVVITFLKALFFDFARLQRLASTTTLTNAEALEAVVQKGQAGGAFGEGLADALGSDGF